MRQLSLLANEYAHLAGLLPSIRAAMRRVAGEESGEGRKVLVDKLNYIAAQGEVRLTAGNAKSVSGDTLDKWLSPTDASHTPSLLAVIVFCAATNDPAPLRILAQALGYELMSEEDRHYRDIGKADVEIEQARKRKHRAKEAL